MDSSAGWLLPGGAAYKLGQRDGKRGERWLPYFFGLLAGWNWNAGREKARREQQEADGR